MARSLSVVRLLAVMVESSIASAAGLHLALALANVRTVEMGGPLMLAEDSGDARTWYDRDTITPPDAPGLGIVVDEAAVARFAEARWMVSA
jgi:L-alanine-DL-glutamate epimerase-like enolase superfamily enzyme